MLQIEVKEVIRVNMEEKKTYSYAFYNIDGKDFYQYLPTSNIADVIYIKGMKLVKKRNFIKDGDYYVEIDNNDSSASVGEPLSSKDILRRYYELDPVFQDFSSRFIEILKKHPDDHWTLYCDGELHNVWHKNYINMNNGEIPLMEEPYNIIKGETHWYLELYHGDGTVTYEKTMFDDGKYRGQDCNSYTLVKVLEYRLNGNDKQVVIEREKNKYPHQSVLQTALDDIIDKAKGLISHQIKFNGFAGVSPLYSFNTEDSACVFYDNQDKVRDSVVTTVTGSGDAVLDLFLHGAKKVIAFDTNILTAFYGELKFIAAKYLPFDDFEYFFATFDERIYNRLSPYLSINIRKFWDELYSYIKLVNKPIMDLRNGGLFYPAASLFSANCTFHNEKGYYTPENYSKLQQILKDKSLDDINFVNCDLFELPDKADLSDSSYAYLSNIMDFIVGIENYDIEEEKLKAFKDFILYKLLPSLKENADIELSYISSGWHIVIEKEYLDNYSTNEGFTFQTLSNKRDSVLSFRNYLLIENKNVGPKKA